MGTGFSPFKLTCLSLGIYASSVARSQKSSCDAGCARRKPPWAPRIGIIEVNGDYSWGRTHVTPSAERLFRTNQHAKHPRNPQAITTLRCLAVR